jgi:hypothetical protein
MQCFVFFWLSWKVGFIYLFFYLFVEYWFYQPCALKSIGFHIFFFLKFDCVFLV